MKHYKNYKKNIDIVIFEDIDGIARALVSGSIATVRQYFKAVNRKAPNEFGGFYGRENAGYKACIEILEKFKNEFEEVRTCHNTTI